MSKEIAEFAKEYVEDVSGFLEISPKVSVLYEEDVCFVDIEGDDLSFLIGYRGTSLSGLQQMLGLALYKKFGEWQNLVVDVNGYRRAKKEKIEEMTKGFIDRVRFFTEEVELPPMPAFERKQVHEFVGSYDDVVSYSVGEGYDRHVVIKPEEQE
jgi:spoIIIJ-associated protein